VKRERARLNVGRKKKRQYCFILKRGGMRDLFGNSDVAFPSKRRCYDKKASIALGKRKEQEGSNLSGGSMKAW